jgi:hypothetical protein
MVPCPFCKEAKKLKMNIRLDSDLWHCWVCNNKGRSLGRLIKEKNPSRVPEYFEKFAKNFTYNSYLELAATIEPVTLPDGFTLLMQNLNHPEARSVYHYAKRRGITDDMLWKFRAGYSDEWQFRRRLIIPSFDEDGTLNYWTSRTIDEDNKYKYINAKANKRAVIFNEIDLSYDDRIYLVEGPLDLIKCYKLNATCLLGSSLSENSVLFYKLAMYCDDIVLCLDADARAKQNNIAELFLSYDKTVSWVDPPAEGQDWGDISPDEVAVYMLSPKVYTANTKLDDLIANL